MVVDPSEASKVLRAFLIDDSATMRKVIRNVLAADSRIRVVGEAENPIAARRELQRTRPDVILLDLEMPRMNGIEFLDKGIADASVQVVVLSSRAQRGSVVVEKALSLGAVDVVAKPSAVQMDTLDGLAERLVRHRQRQQKAAKPAAAVRSSGLPPEGHDKILLIGASTGGVEAVSSIVQHFPVTCPPTVVAQHMPENFLRAFVARLNRNVRPDVSIAADGQALRSGSVVFAPGGANHLIIERDDQQLIARYQPGPPIMGHIPSIDVLMQSALPIAPKVCAVLLSGMGSDGVSGLVGLKAAGAHTAVQDKGTSVIFGMGRRAADQGAVDRMLPLKEIGNWAMMSCRNAK